MAIVIVVTARIGCCGVKTVDFIVNYNLPQYVLVEHFNQKTSHWKTIMMSLKQIEDLLKQDSALERLWAF
jgi:hypothetical protein